MAKTAFIADVHFGVPGRLRDILWALRVVRQFCSEYGIDVVVVLGDWLHNRKHVEIDVLCAASDFLVETKRDYEQQWIIFPGNHDMFLRHSWDINSVLPFSESAQIINGIKRLEIEDANFWILPFIALEKSYMRAATHIADHKDFRPDEDVLLTHIGVRSATLNTCFLLKDWSTVEFEDLPFAKVYTGHFHSTQKVGSKVWYPGSLIPFKFDEGDVPHGFFVYDTATKKHAFVDIWKAGAKFFPDEPAPPQYYTIKEEELDSRLNELQNAVVRVATAEDKSQDARNQLKEKLVSVGARDVRWLNSKAKEEVRETVHVQNVDVAAFTQRNIFQHWLDRNPTSTKGLDHTVLLRLNDEVVREGDELYAVEEAESVL